MAAERLFSPPHEEGQSLYANIFAIRIIGVEDLLQKFRVINFVLLPLTPCTSQVVKFVLLFSTFKVFKIYRIVYTAKSKVLAFKKFECVCARYVTDDKIELVSTFSYFRYNVS